MATSEESLCHYCRKIYFAPLTKFNTSSDLTLAKQPIANHTRWDLITEPHQPRSLFYLHHPTRESFRLSIEQGCHFCTMISARSESYRVSDHDIVSQPAYIVLRRAYSWEPHARRDWRDEWGDITAYFEGRRTTFNALSTMLGELTWSKPYVYSS